MTRWAIEMSLTLHFPSTYTNAKHNKGSTMRLILLLSLLYTSLSFAKLPQSPAEVEVLKEKDELTYENIPRIKKLFKGARDNDQRQILEEDCRKWVATQVVQANAPYYKVWCTLKKDIVLREYSYTGNLLIKNWR